MTTFRSVAALAAGTALALASVAAAPTTDAPDTTVDGDTLTVTGSLTEPLAPIVIGTDDLGDAATSGAGMDVTEYAVSFPTPNEIAFHVTLGDANPATGYFPQGTAFEIAPTVGGDGLELTAVATIDGGLTFGAQTCAVNPDTGVNECATTPIEGEYVDGVVTWFLPTGATPESQINGNYVHVNYHVGTGATGGVTFVNGIIDQMGITAFAATPSARLLVDGALVGTAALSDTGYTVTAGGLTTGDHTATLELCGGDADFAGAMIDCTAVDLGTITVG